MSETLFRVDPGADKKDFKKRNSARFTYQDTNKCETDRQKLKQAGIIEFVNEG